MPPTTARTMDDAQRRALLDAARGEFAAHGFDKASLNRILETAEISKGSFYYHFANKHALFESVFRDTIVPMVRDAGRPTPATDAEGFWHGIFRWMDGLSRGLEDRPENVAILRVAANMMSDPRFVETFEDMRQSIQGPVIAVIENGQDVGAVRTDMPPQLIATLVFAVDEQLDRFMLQREPLTKEDMEEWKHLGIDLMRRLVRPKGGAA